jgi:hypothetical protein
MVSIEDARAMVYPVLISVGRAGQKVFYMDLWKMSGLNPGWRRYMGTIVGEISEKEILNGNPPLSAIVIGVTTGYPGGGFFGLPCIPPTLARHGRAQQSLPLTEVDKEYIRAQQSAVWKCWGAAL